VAAKHGGKWVLETNDEKLSLKNAAQASPLKKSSLC